MPLENKDANLVDESSPSTGADTQVEQQQTGAKGQTSPTDASGEGKEKVTMRSIAHSIADAFKSKPKTEGKENTTDGKAEPAVPFDNRTEQQQGIAKEGEIKEKATEVQTQKPPLLTEVDDSKLPFHKHPRFQQVLTERNNFKKQQDEAQPLYEAGKRMQTVETYCRDNSISAEDYDNSIRIAALVNKDPKQAEVVLEKLLSELKVKNGSALPSDLQTRVDEGKLSLTDAQEIAGLRVKSQGSEHEVKRTQARVQQDLRTQLERSVDSWVKSKMASDPSFKPSAEGEFGKFEQVQDRIETLVKQESPKTVDDLIKISDKAYKQVHSFIEKNLPRPQVKRPLSPKNSATIEEKVINISKPGWGKQAIAGLNLR